MKITNRGKLKMIKPLVIVAICIIGSFITTIIDKTLGITFATTKKDRNYT